MGDKSKQTHPDTQSSAGRWSLEDVKGRIERQTGFPAELKVARMVLEGGWTYIANPRFSRNTSDDDLSEIDLIATWDDGSESPWIEGSKLETGIIELVIDVKSYKRPLIVFSSRMTDRDLNCTYSEVIYIDEKLHSQRSFCLLTEFLNRNEITQVEV